MTGPTGSGGPSSSSSSSRLMVTLSVTGAPACTSSASSTLYSSSTLGYRLQNCATSFNSAGDICRIASRSASSSSVKSNTVSTSFSAARLSRSGVMCGICFRYESLAHVAWTTICDSSIAARAADSHELVERTSTMAWISRKIPRSTTFKSSWNSAESCNRWKCACRRSSALVWGSLNRAFFGNLIGSRLDNFRRTTSSLWRMGMVANSFDADSISSRCLILVLAVSKREKSSIVV
mmetsp:Transcript_33244/g.87075  ORF Transcript_33244/g.87075 Transcript_33244/m.87075 type:complete len:236 (+) Transcript_33244:652-1359(+)